MPNDGGALKRLGFECAARTDVGLVRGRNEDALWADTRRGWLLLADGMGGHCSGDQASALAISHVLGRLRDSEKRGVNAACAELLADSMIEANTAIRDAARQSSCADVMGTTFVGAVLEPDEMVYAYVGDSRLYLLRDKMLTQLSRDHTVVQEFVDSGQITARMAQNHPYRGLLTRGLGVQDDVEPVTGTHLLRPGDRLLLCTDGLTDMVDEDEIALLLGMSAGADVIAKSLVEAAKAAGGCDNVSVIVAWFVPRTHYYDDRCATDAHHKMDG
ncbi:MAG: protein phosphatase 2C domain-containing protein [Azoarcus sp.]|jgi:protein phosphatase|nr:protein phosphatase 2C domain-containing protein [Azoarcus sp.]